MDKEEGSFAAGILGVGTALPSRVLTNFDLEQMVDTSDEWIVTRTGIRERRLAGDDQATSDLAAEAAAQALKNAGLESRDIDLLILATSSPDLVFPSTACIVQQKLGLHSVPAFDVSAACTGFVYALAVGASLVESGAQQRVLVVAADAFSKLVNWKDRNTCVLFGDGAGAVVLGRVSAGFGIIGSYLAADGSGVSMLQVPAGGSALPASAETVGQGLHYVQMNGREIFKFAVRVVPETCRRLTEASQIRLEEVRYIIPHQANTRIIDAAAERLAFPPERIVNNIEHLGNTSTASIPLALGDLRDDLNEGDLLIFVAFGGGLTWGGNLVRWGGAS